MRAGVRFSLAAIGLLTVALRRLIRIAGPGRPHEDPELRELRRAVEDPRDRGRLRDRAAPAPVDGDGGGDGPGPILS